MVVARALTPQQLPLDTAQDLHVVSCAYGFGRVGVELAPG